jgi:lipopolysaccharide/colanic/teichoic acid biosynthesis glycosyltransferase
LDQVLKRCFDFLFALLGLLLCWPLILACWTIAAIETRGNGFFVQERIGRHGQIIRVVKIKTMHSPRYHGGYSDSPIAALHANAITRSGVVFRRWKFDELPQLINVLKGDMSFVGPRPDVTGYADRLLGSDRVILLMRPGITGPASLKYRDEEALLAASDDPVSYNDKVIWPDKVRINKAYYHEYSLLRDVRYIIRTVFH